MKNNHEHAKATVIIQKNDLAIKCFAQKAIEAAKNNNFKLSKNYFKKIDSKILMTKKIYDNLLFNDSEKTSFNKTLINLLEDHLFSSKIWRRLSNEIVNLYILISKN